MEKRVKVGALPLALLLAQTTQTVQIDLSIIYSVLPVMISLIVLVMVLGIITGFFRSIGDMLRGALRYTKLKYPTLLLLFTVAQTATQPVQIDLSIIYSVLPVMISLIVIVMVLGIITGMFRSLGEFLSSAFTRQAKISSRRFFRTCALALLLAQTTYPVPAEQLYGQAISVLNVLLPIMIALILLVILLTMPMKVFRDLAHRIME